MAIALGMFYFSTFTVSGGKPVFYQSRFSPAIMLACGKGFVNPIPKQVPALNNFLLTQVDTFACNEWPANLATTKRDIFQEAHQYLLITVAFIWAVTGVSWSGLAPLFGILFGVVIASAYGIFRLGMSRFLAMLCTLGLTVSYLHLKNLPHLRDYSKAPFILVVILILGWLVIRPLRPSTLLGLSSVAGAVLGLGFGFRTDLFIHVLPCVFVLLFFLPGSVRSNIKLKIKALILFSLSFLIMAWPIVYSYLSLGSNTSHVVLLGLMSPFTQDLGITDSLLYDWGHFYNDSFIYAILDSYAYRIHGHPVRFATPEYDHVGAQYLFEIIKNFPADMIVRIYASILKILDLPTTYMGVPFGINNKTAIGFYQWRAKLFPLLVGIIPYITGVMLLIISAYSLRKALFLLMFLLYFAGSPAIQFSDRHFFHLEFIGLWIIGFVVQQTIQFVNTLVHREARQSLIRTLTHPKSWWSAPTWRLLGFGLGVLIIIIGPLWLLRIYQHLQVGTLLQAYIVADKEPLVLTQTPLNNDRILITSSSQKPPVEPNSTLHPTFVEYLVLEFNAKEPCDAPVVTVTFRYEVGSNFNDRSETLNIRLLSHTDTSTWMFYPVYYKPVVVNFKGIEMPQKQLACLHELYRVKDVSRFPLLLNLILPPNWEQARRYQTLVK